ncbi:MAG: hypothetical protein WB558_17935 [Terriglobales bacterium]
MKPRVVWATVAALVVFGAFSQWREVDHYGWIPHRQLTHVWVPVEQPWGVGEYLNCRASPRAPMTAPPGSPGIENLACVRRSESEQNNGHLLPEDVEVTYWGRIAIPYPESAQLYRKIMTTPDSAPYDKLPFRWHCRRNESSVTCWAVN